MGLWDKAKEDFEKGREAVEEVTYTQEYDEEDAKRVAAEMNHDVEPNVLRRKKVGKAPLD